mgnify:CR=1 FL=1
MKKVMSVLALCGLLALSGGSAFAAQWKLAHIRPADSVIERDLQAFAKEVREATDGRIDIRIYGSSQLGDYTVVQEKVSLGSVEMSCESVSTQVDKRFLSYILPYVAKDYATAKKNFGTGTPYAKYCANLFDKQDIMVLANWPVYFGGIGLVKAPEAPADPNASHHIKVRVPTMKTQEALADGLGYQATPLPFAEFFTAAQTGMVSGIFGGGAENYYASFRDLLKCYIAANTHFENWPLLINKELFESLSAEDQKILLSNNFRSAGKVIDTINQIFEPLMSENLGGIDYDESAKLHIGRQDKNNMGYGSEILIVRNDCADSEKSQPEEIRSLTNVDIEARMIADEIYELVKGDKPLYIPDGDNGETRRVSYRDIAVLMRSVKKNAKAFEEAFAERGIPLFVESESGYFDAIEISTLLDMLAVIDNSHQDYALAAVLRSPLAGVKEQELAEIVGIYDRDFKDHEKNLARTASFYQKVCYYAEKPDSEASEELRQFLRMLDSWKADKNYMSISELLHSILEQTGYYWFVGAMQSGKRRQANIDMLIQKADTYEDSSFRGLFNFLRYMDRLKTNDLDFAEASVLGDDDDSVVMMTMHKSKGLEFPVVFVSGLANRFSNLDALSPVTVNADSYLAGYAIDRKNRAKKKTFARAAMLSVMNAEKLAEEIRILYVALSRAKEKLYMTAAVKDPGAEKAVFDYPLQTDFLIEASGQMRMELPYITRMEAGCFMDWILSALSMHIVSEDIVCRKDTYATWVLAKTGYQNQILAGTKTDMSEENAVQIENETENKSKSMIAQEDRQLYEKYKELLDYTYPYKTEQAVKNKMSVTEIKRLAHRGEENPGSDLYQPPVTEAELTIPVLHSRMKEEPVKGNEMGTVIHKIMELIDFTRNSMDEIREQIRSFFDHGYLEERYREHVRADKIYNMVNSPLGIRMAEAQKNHTLYREQQFYIGMKPEDISPEYKDSKDMVVVQGVIDAYFLEGDQVVLMDYKTDRVDQISDLVSRYHVQLDMYAKTIHQLTGRMVTEKIIYAFHFDDSINL